jgi:NAD(P)H-flavin reductase
MMQEDADATDQKGNRYYKRKLLGRTFLANDLVKLTFELPKGVSLKTQGFDIGLGDFVRIRPFSEEHRKLVENPGGGRAYSPVFSPEVEGQFGLIIKPYGPADKVVGMSSLLRNAPIGSEFLVTNHVEHIFWKERNWGYWCNERNIDVGNEAYCLGLIAFGIGITEIAPVAMSELLDPRVKQVTILWANKSWSDAEWVWSDACNKADDLVHKFFAEQGKYGARLKIKHILSREERPEACFNGRINAAVLKKAFLEDGIPQDQLKILSVGTTAMTNFAYEELSKLGLDIKKEKYWGGNNLLYRKAEGSAPTDRILSPLLAATSKEDSKHPPASSTEEPRKKRAKI